MLKATGKALKQSKRNQRVIGRATSSVYPLHPPESRWIVRSPEDLSLLDRLLVGGSSLLIVGSVAWVPLCIAWSWRRWRRVKGKRRKAMYAGLAMAALALVAVGPHRSPRFGRWIQIRKWRLWKSWMKFIAMEVILDRTSTPPPLDPNMPQQVVDVQSDRVILAFSPHGIFPFSIAFPAILSHTFGVFRPVVATATELFPIVRDFLSWLEAVYVLFVH